MSNQELDNSIEELSNAIYNSILENESIKDIINKIKNESGLNTIFDVEFMLLDDDQFEELEDDEENVVATELKTEKISSEITATDIEFLSKLKIRFN